MLHPPMANALDFVVDLHQVHRYFIGWILPATSNASSEDGRSLIQPDPLSVIRLPLFC